MSDDKQSPVGSGGRQREETITQKVDEMTKGAPDEGRKLPRGRTGVSRPASPRPGVRYVDPESARKGEEGEKAYGPPTSPPPVQQEESEKRKQARPDPLKKK
jgi:hypothetical protein